MSFYVCDINNLEGGFHKAARKSYEKHGFFLFQNVLSSKQVIEFRKAFDQLFLEAGDGRQRSLRKTEANSDARKKMSEHHANLKLNRALVKIFPESDISWLPPFNIAHNYLPHSVLTRAAGWHRDASGETGIQECRKLMKRKDYFFGKTGLYLQPNSDHGGAIDVIPRTNNDLSSFSFRKYKVFFLLKLLVFSQKYLPWAYKSMSRGSLFSKLLGSKTLPIKAGDCAVFDARIWHKGTFADEIVEKKLKYNIGKIQAKLPPDKTKYVLYSHIGNSIGTESYLMDRLNRKDNEAEDQYWIDDTSALSQSLEEIPMFFRKSDSILDKSFFSDRKVSIG